MILAPSLPHASTSAADAYFAPVDGLHGDALADGLRKLWDSTDRPLGYAPARDEMFAKLGRSGGSDWATDIYTGQALVGVDSRASANAHNVNAEHLWPQSQGAVGRLRTDLHHIQATNQKVNEYRWHLPFGAVVDAQDGAAPFRIPAGSGSVGFDTNGRLVFEPRDAVKGVIARSLMYAYERYGTGSEIGTDFDPSGFTESLPTLLAWNAAHLPDADELRRNDMIQAIQGTRNVFVDRPELADELMAGRATPAATRIDRAQQVQAWATFLKDPASNYRVHDSDLAA